jgi:hypothetical protein
MFFGNAVCHPGDSPGLTALKCRQHCDGEDSSYGPPPCRSPPTDAAHHDGAGVPLGGEIGVVRAADVHARFCGICVRDGEVDPRVPAPAAGLAE